MEGSNQIPNFDILSRAYCVAPFHLNRDNSGYPILKDDFTGKEITSKQSFACSQAFVSRENAKFQAAEDRFDKIAFRKVGRSKVCG